MGTTTGTAQEPTDPDPLGQQEESATRARPPILYKYMGVEYGIEVFTKARIKYTQPGELNDPFECKPFLLGPVDPEHRNESMASQHVKDNIEKIAQAAANKGNRQQRRQKNSRRTYKVIRSKALTLFHQSMDNLDQKHTHYINREVATYRDRIAMVCLTESRTNLLMWSHYADQHAGFVIGVHTAHPCFNRQRSEADDHNYFRPVIYSDVRPNFYMNQIRSREPIILTKSREWKDEKEWRIVAPLELLTKDPKNGKYFYDLPIEAIKEVYMGVRISPALRNRIIEELVKRQDQHTIKLFQMEQSERHYALVEKEVHYRT
ncbi:DUF2971 domain-containing protein [Skermanella mucosa]|uniref:DUF2971 domain-containing protein n=1 Tax=Skermanella mucosa TaxID=1789672 RepID=UPI00192BA104|nr:DUF2971 domain-containing protein [Skermanella mucosa]UEM19003.1 DUF2971 domain-containing protein [Skermanella mucosa]